MHLDETGTSMEETAASAARPLRCERTIWVAWSMLLVAFGVFCAGSISALLIGWNYYQSATVSHEGTLILRTSSEWVMVQRRGRATFERAAHEQPLKEGDRVRILSSAGYGQAATIRLPDGSTLDMWADATVLLSQMSTTRWNDREQVLVIEQEMGYIRYDIRPAQRYAVVDIRVQAAATTARLEPGGSYSVAMVPPLRREVLPPGYPHDPIGIDIAVRAGRADVSSAGRNVTLRAGERLAIDAAGIPGSPQPAAWQLIRDGCFTAHTEEEYNNTTITGMPSLPRASTWRVFSGPADAGASGFFKLSSTFQPLNTPMYAPPMAPCYVAWFVRTGGQTRGFVTGVRQMLGSSQVGVDISEYHSLTFSAWVRVLNQSLDGTGELGTECPIMIRFLSKESNPTDAEQEHVMCIYTSRDPTQPSVHAPNITYLRVQPYQWHLVQLELRDMTWLPEARYLRSIELYANGHDYNAQVTRISLIGTHHRSTD